MSSYGLDFEGEIPVLAQLFAGQLASRNDDVTLARHHQGLRALWAAASPESRRQLLLFVSWGARESTASTTNKDTLSTADQYARAFAHYASSWAEQHPEGGVEGFCTEQHSARLAASSLAFDHDELNASLETVLLLVSRSAQPEA
ncbi:hypothetical protein ACO0M4_11935 [Streptomyces sp. RGM 3693]|uniref:hypothetical protein n=1 Tax=Streptomyces sp. RGM 3693 TaxID=3413284 RepID=UPI003D2D98D3